MHTELCISKVNSRERRKFSLDLLAEALEDIDQEEIIKISQGTINQNQHQRLQAKLHPERSKNQTEKHKKKINDLELELL